MPWVNSYYYRKRHEGGKVISEYVGTAHANIKSKLHGNAWALARFAKIRNIENNNIGSIANHKFANANWKELMCQRMSANVRTKNFNP